MLPSSRVKNTVFKRKSNNMDAPTKYTNVFMELPVIFYICNMQANNEHWEREYCNFSYSAEGTQRLIKLIN